MVNHLIRLTLLSILLSNAFVKNSFSQERKVYNKLSDYSNWSFVAGPVLYKKATITPQYGNLTFDNKPMPGFNAGIEYDFYTNAKWSFLTGFYVAIEPVYNLEFTLEKKDLYNHFDEDLTDQINAYSIITYSLPLTLRHNIQIGNNTFLSFLTGLKVMYYPNGGFDMIYAISSEELSETREMFGLKLESPQNAFQGSFVLGTGFSYALQKVLLKTNLIYVFNFQNTITGEYQFANLFTSADTRGDYELSGNYLGLLFSVSLKKGKKNDK